MLLYFIVMRVLDYVLIGLLGKAWSLFLIAALLTGISIAVAVSPFVGLICSLTYISAVDRVRNLKHHSNFWMLLLSAGLEIHVLLAPADEIGLAEVVALGASLIIIRERNTAPFCNQLLGE